MMGLIPIPDLVANHGPQWTFGMHVLSLPDAQIGLQQHSHESARCPAKWATVMAYARFLRRKF